MDENNLLNPSDPMSPLSPVHPLNTETQIVAPLPHEAPPCFDWTTNEWTVVLLVIGALILAGWWWICRRERRKQQQQRRLEILEMSNRMKYAVEEPEKPECQSCQHFISCSMAQVKSCPLMKKDE